MTSKSRLALVIGIGALLTGLEAAAFYVDLKPLIVHEKIAGYEMKKAPSPYQPPAPGAPLVQPAPPESPKLALCHGEDTVEVRPEGDGYAMQVPLTWTSNAYVDNPNVPYDFGAQCSLSGALSEAYLVDGEMSATWEVHRSVPFTAEEWFKSKVEISPEDVKKTVEGMASEAPEVGLTAADFHSAKETVTIDGRSAIMYTWYWDKTPGIEGGPTKWRTYVVTNGENIYVATAVTSYGPQADEVLAYFDAAVKTMRFDPPKP